MNSADTVSTRLPGAPDNATTLHDDRGEIAIWEASPRLLRSVLRGHLSARLAEQLATTIERMLAGRTFDLFHDWSGYTGHDPAARAAMTQWAFRNRAQLRSLNILMPPPNKMVAMAIAASNMVLGGFMRIHHTRASFEAELARVEPR